MRGSYMQVSTQVSVGVSKVGLGMRCNRTLKAITGLRLLADHVEHRVDQLSTLSVMALGPVVAGAGLSKDEVVWAEDLAEGSRAHRVHGAWLKIHQDGTRNVTP